MLGRSALDSYARPVPVPHAPVYAIVAAENAVARVMLKTTLERMGFTVGEVRDELGAASLMAQTTAPDLALLDFQTLRVSFGEVCQALRALRPGVYIVALIPAERSAEILDALHAGADDFMLHSEAIQEVEGRLRVIARNLTHRASMPAPASGDAIGDAGQPALEPRPPSAPSSAPSFAEDPFMLMDEAPAYPPKPKATPTGTAAADASPTRPDAPDAPRAPVEPEGDRAPGAPPREGVRLKPARPDRRPREHGLFEALDFPGALRKALMEFDLPRPFGIDPTEASTDSAYSTWALVVARRGPDAFWCALQLDIDRAPMDALYRRILRRAPRSDEERLRLLQQIMGLTQRALQDMGDESGVFEVYVPRTPTARPTAQLPVMLISTQADRRRFGLALDDTLRLRLTVVMNLTHLHEQPLMQMRPYDLLAAPLQTTDHLMLLNAGTLLDESYIDKIQAMSYARTLMPTIRVFPPPSSVAIFLRRIS